MRAIWSVLMPLVFTGVALAQPAADRPITVPRERVLATDGIVLPNDTLRLWPVEEGVGVVFNQPVSRDGAIGLRFQFHVERRPAEPTWAVRVLDRQKRVVWMYSPAGSPGEDDFWSDEVPGSQATIEVVSIALENEVRLTVSKILTTRQAFKPLAITDPNQLERYAGKPDPIRTWGRAVARLRFVGSDGRQYVCTGFMITPDLMLTNDHCISTDAERRSALVDFHYDGGGAATRTLRLRELVLSDTPRDYSLVRLARRPGVGTLSLQPASLGAKQDLIIIQHPGGEVKQVSVVQCFVVEPSVAGLTVERTDFEHFCDTKGGSSGSPVFDPARNAVVGLHHLGFLPEDKRLVNRAVSIGEVLKHIRSTNESVWKEITGGYQPP